jgi:hypothetical protein
MSEPDPSIPAASPSSDRAPGAASPDDASDGAAGERTPRFEVPSRDEEVDPLEEFAPDAASAGELDSEAPEPDAALPLSLADASSRPSSRATYLLLFGLLLAVAAQGLFIGARLLGQDRAPETAVDGAIVLYSRPSGAEVVIDGRPLGRTPVRARVWPGSHVIQLQGADGAVRRQRIGVGAGQTASHYIELGTTSPPPLPPLAAKGGAPAKVAATRPRRPSTIGRVRITSEIPLLVFEGGTQIGSSDAGQLEFRGGKHLLTLVNERFGFRSEQMIEVVAGRTEVVTVALPAGQLSANATPWAEVFVNGRLLGETPIGEAMLPLGHYDLVFRHPQLGERRVPVTIRADRPSIATVDFSD